MKKLLPFIFPTAALVLVTILAFRWYRMRSANEGQIPEFAEGVEIENLSQAELEGVLRGVGDFETIPLESENDEYLGQLRYEIEDGKVRFSVSAALPELEDGNYQVWLKEVNGLAMRKAFLLDFSKAGFMGSAAISADTLPFEVLVSRELIPDDALEEVLFRGILEAETESPTGEEIEPTN